MKERIQRLINERKWFLMFIASLVILFISLILFIFGVDENIIKNLRLSGFLLILLALFGSLWAFYSSDKRLEHQFNAFHGSAFLSGFYRIFFPVVILAIIIQFIVSFALSPESNGGWGVLDPDVSPSGSIIFIIAGIITGIGLIVLSDFEMRKKNILLAPRGKKISYFGSLMYVVPLLGFYFGLRFFVKFFLIQIYGEGALIPTSDNFFTLDGGVVTAARFWIFLTDREKFLTFIAFLSLYIGAEFLLRGLLSNEARSYGLGAAGIVFVPAIIQAFAFSSGTFLITDTVYYFFILFDALVLGIVVGITLWRTGRFSTTLTIAILARLLDNESDFQITVLSILPEGLGEYNRSVNISAIQTNADKIGFFLTFVEIVLVIIAPFIIIVSYRETWKIVSQLWDGLKKQWFGYLILGLAFFIIDMVFSFIAAQNPLGPILGFIIALFIIGFILNYLFQILPPATDPAQFLGFTDAFEGEFPVNVANDVQWLDSSNHWYENPLRMGLFGGSIFLYFAFVSAAYRQFEPLSGIEQIKFVTFLIIMPTVLFAVSLFLLSNAISNGYFFASDYRKGILTILTVGFIINMYLWTLAAAISNFTWRYVPVFVLYTILIWANPIRNPSRDIAIGLAKGGRYATFKRMKNEGVIFEETYQNLLELKSDNVQIGIKILASQLRMTDEWDEIDNLRTSDLGKGQKIGSIMALGILGSQSSEGALLKLLDDQDNDVKAAAFWALGKIGSTTVLARMAQILEENPMKSLLQIGEQAILRIDPSYPLAGLRDSIIIE